MHTLQFLPIPFEPAAAIVADAKTAVSLLVALGGAGATLAGNWNAITEGRTLPAKIKLKTERVKELVDLINELKDTDDFAPCRKKLHKELGSALLELGELRAREAQKRKPDRNALTLWQRLFLFFPPRRPHAWLVHGFAFLFMFGGPFAIILMALFGGEDKSSLVSDLVILVVFGALAFRGWALAERRWALEKSRGPAPCTRPGDSLACELFVMREPGSRAMATAQICMWAALFCVLESLEDLLFEGIENKQWTPAATASLSLLFFAILVAGLCRAWANEEYKHVLHPTDRPGVFPVLKSLIARHLPVTILSVTAAAFVARWQWSVIAHVPSAVLLLWKDGFDRGEVAFLLLSSCLAIAHTLPARSLSRESAASEPGPPNMLAMQTEDIPSRRR